jgi:hypothetical protein
VEASGGPPQEIGDAGGFSGGTWSSEGISGCSRWADKKAAPLVATPFNETHGQISPDGKWIAFTDNSKDGRNEIYVKPFPTGNGGWQVSNTGGDWPRWRRDSKELFYHSPVSNAGSGNPYPFGGPMFSVQFEQLYRLGLNRALVPKQCARRRAVSPVMAPYPLKIPTMWSVGTLSSRASVAPLMLSACKPSARTSPG